MPEPLPKTVASLYEQMRKDHAKLEKEGLSHRQITPHIVEGLMSRLYPATTKALDELWRRHAEARMRYLDEHIQGLEKENPAHHEHVERMEQRTEFIEAVKQNAHLEAVAASRMHGNYLGALRKATGRVLRSMLDERLGKEMQQNERPRVTALTHGRELLRAHALDANDIYAAMNKPARYKLEPSEVDLLRAVYLPDKPIRMIQLAKQREMKMTEFIQAVSRSLKKISIILKQNE